MRKDERTFGKSAEEFGWKYFRARIDWKILYQGVETVKFNFK